jgi:hypothetical protein
MVAKLPLLELAAKGSKRTINKLRAICESWPNAWCSLAQINLYKRNCGGYYQFGRFDFAKILMTTATT